MEKYLQSLYEVWDVITFPFTSFNGCIVEIWEWTVISSRTLHIQAGIKDVHVRKRDQQADLF